MGVNHILIGVAVYLLLGIVFLGIFDLVTQRIHTKFTQAVSDTQQRLGASGNYVGNRASACLFVITMWLFWPMVFIGALTDKKGEERKNG